jgi:hypothetical protein
MMTLISRDKNCPIPNVPEKELKEKTMAACENY